MKTKFVLPLLVAAMLTGCNAGGNGGSNPPGPTQYTETVIFNAFTRESKASEEGPRELLIADLEAVMVKSTGGSLITDVSFGDTSTKNTQINEVGYKMQDGEPVNRYNLFLGTGSKAGELHFTFVDTLVKVKIYANAYYNWAWNESLSAYAKTRDKGSTLTVNDSSMTVTQCGTGETEEAYESKEFAINGKQLDISNEPPTSTAKKRVLIQKMEFTFQK